MTTPPTRTSTSPAENSPTPHRGDRPAQSVGTLMAALILGGITPILDTTIVAIGLHSLTTALSASVSTIQWVSTAYLLTLAVAIPFSSWAQARFGGKRLWLAALALFVLGSALCACSWNAASLIAFRALQGLGGGVLFPLMQTLAMQNTPSGSRTKTMATVSLPIALGPILGPVLGGVVLNWLSWRWMFLINVPIGILGWIIAAFVLADDRPAPDSPRPHFDIVGAILVVPALAGLLLGLSNSSKSGGFSRADVLVPLIGGAALLAAFVVQEVRRGQSALVDVRLLAVRSVRISSIGLTFAGAVLFAGNFLLPLYFQTLRGDSALDAALLLIPQGAGTLLIRFAVGRLVDRYGARLVCFTGATVMALATIPFALADSGTSLWILGVALFIRGLGNGVLLIPIMSIAYDDISTDQMPHASAITRIAQQLGGAFGTALLATVLTSATSPTDPAHGFDVAFWWAMGLTVATACVATLMPGRPRVNAEAIRTVATS